MQKSTVEFEPMRAEAPVVVAQGSRLTFVTDPETTDSWLVVCQGLLADGYKRIGARLLDDRLDGSSGEIARVLADKLGPAFAVISDARTTAKRPVSRSDASTTAADEIGMVAGKLDAGKFNVGEADAALLLSTDAEAVSAALLDYVDEAQATVVAPVTGRYWEKLPLYLISIPKAGTHLLFQLVEACGYKPGGSTPQHPTGGYWYYLLNTNAHTGADEFFQDALQKAPFGNRAHPFMRSPALFNYRNPLDILVSEANYFHLDGKSPLSVLLSPLSFEQRVDKLIEDSWFLGSLRDRVGRFAPWLDCANVIPVSFEEMVGDAGGGSDAALDRLIWSIQLKLHIPGNPAVFRAALKGRASPTFREGRIGGWRQKLSSTAVQKFRSLPQDFMKTYGYDVDAQADDIPSHATTFLRRPIRLSRADFSSTPVLVRSGVLGHNLVAYRKTYFAVSADGGAVDLTTFSDEQLAVLPQGYSEFDVIAVLAAQQARAAGPASAFKANAETRSDPVRLFTVGGFNVVQHGPVVYGIRHGLASIDYEVGAERLVAMYDSKDVVIGDNPAGVASEIAIREVAAVRDAMSHVAAEVRDGLSRSIDELQTKLGETIRQALATQLPESLNVLETLVSTQAERLRADVEGAIASRLGAQMQEQLARNVAELPALMEASMVARLRFKRVGWATMAGSIQGYNIIRRDDAVLAVPQHLGVIDPHEYALRDRQGVIVSHNRVFMRCYLWSRAVWRWLRWAYWDGAKV